MNNSKILLIFFACLVIVFVVTKMIDYHEKKLEDGAVNNGNLFNGKISNILQVVKKNVNKMGESIKKTSSQSEDDGECFMKPDFSKENYTEFMRKRLVVDLAKFKNERRNLKGKCEKEKYIWNTTDKFLKDELNQISKIVIERLNNQCRFDFNYSGYGDINVKKDCKGNKHYIYELFVWDKVNFFQVKLNINLIKYVKKGYVEDCSRENNPNLVFPYYKIGIPSKEQLVPTPMDVIPTGNVVLSTASIKYPVPSPIEYLYINLIDVENSTLIINHTQKNKDTLCGGFGDGSECFSFVKGDSDPYIEPAVIRNKWTRLPNQPYCMNTWPCTPKPNDWDSLGVYEPDVKDSKECPGETWAAEYVYPQPTFNPTVTELPRDCGQNYWLFDLTNGSGASASSASQPAP